MLLLMWGKIIKGLQTKRLFKSCPTVAYCVDNSQTTQQLIYIIILACIFKFKTFLVWVIGKVGGILKTMSCGTRELW